MRVFVTGATGFIGSAIVQELLGAGHEVLGLARSEEGAQKLAAAGARAYRGDLEDPESLRQGAADSDGVIHTAFIHDFSRFQAVCETDRQAIGILAETLAGSNRPLVVTSGTALVNPGQLATEDMMPATNAHPRLAAEQAAVAEEANGVRTSVIRLSPITI